MIARVLAAAVIAASVAVTGACAPEHDTSADCHDFGAGFIVCAPSASPSGAPIVGRVEEDGSARYADGASYDAETGFDSP